VAYSATINTIALPHAAGSGCRICHVIAASQAGATAAGATRSHRCRHASPNVSVALTTRASVTAVSGSVALATIKPTHANCAMNAAVVRPLAATVLVPWARREIGSQATPYARTTSIVTRATLAQSSPAAASDHPNAMSAADTTPVACSAAARVASDAALLASVITASAPSIGQGGADHSGLTATKKRKK